MPGMDDAACQGFADDLLREGMGLLADLDDVGVLAESVDAAMVDQFEARARKVVPAQHMELFEDEAACLGHGQYAAGDQSKLAGLLDGLAAVDHRLRGLEPAAHVPGPCRAWLPDKPSRMVRGC